MAVAAPVIFVWDGFNRAALKISKPKVEDPKNPNAKEKALLARYKRLCAAANGDTIVFQARGIASKPWSTFATSDAELIGYIRANKRKGMREDLSLMPVRCPYCEFLTEGNSQAHQEQLALHISEVHPPDAVDAS